MVDKKEVGIVLLRTAPLVKAGVSWPAAILQASLLSGYSPPIWVNTVVARLTSGDDLATALVAGQVDTLTALRVCAAAGVNLEQTAKWLCEEPADQSIQVVSVLRLWAVTLRSGDSISSVLRSCPPWGPPVADMVADGVSLPVALMSCSAPEILVQVANVSSVTVDQFAEICEVTAETLLM